MKKLLIALLLITPSVFADEASFLKMCKNFEALPSAEKTTMRSLIKIGSGTFTSDMKSCDEVLEFFKNVDELHMRGSTFEYIFVDSLAPIVTLDWIKKLSIANQKINDITPLSKMNLTNLIISGTEVKDFNQLRDFRSLEELTANVQGHSDLKVLLNNTFLKSLNIHITGNADLGFRFLENISQLESLSISTTSFLESKVTIRFLDELTNLKSLTVNRGHIDARELINLPLEILHLVDHNSTKISFMDHLAFVTSLKKLSLPKQDITDPSFLGKLTNLVELNLNDNFLQDASFMESLVNLEKLNIGRNNLWQDSHFRNLTKLKVLNATSNRFSFFNMSNLTALEEVNLSNNNLHRLTTSTHPKLKKLDLKDNNLRSRNLNFINLNMSSLEELYLNHNKISHLKGLANVKTLRRLSLDDNKITSIEVLSNLINLEFLSLRANLILPEDRICPVQRSDRKVCDFLHQDI